MNWLQKIATAYLDTQMFHKPGFPDWQDKIKEVNAKRDKIQQRAEEKAEGLGHTLSPWTCMNSSMCRQCGSTVYLHNIHGSTDADDMDGRAVTDKCHVHFDGSFRPVYGEDYTVQDYNGKTII